MQKNLLFVTLIMTLALAGCGPKGANTCLVEGLVTLDGTPLTDALVSFIPVNPLPPDGKTATGYSDASGKYLLTSDGGLPGKGALAGEYKVTVYKVEVKETPGRLRADDPPGSIPQAVITQTTITPEVYKDAKTTTLTATVTKGKNTINLELKK